MKGINYTQISAGMTAKERAQLVVKLQLKAFDEIGTKDLPLPYQSEISSIVAACPGEQARDYNFYIALKDEVWTKLLPTIEILQLELQLFRERASTLMNMIHMSPFVSDSLKYVKNTPKIVSLEEYKEGIEKAKGIIKNEVLEIDGRFGLAQEEAFYKLIKEGKIHKESDITAYVDSMEDYEKSDELLLKEAVDHIKEYAQTYFRRKERTGIVDSFWKKYKNFVGATDEEIIKHIKDNEADWIEKPGKDEYELWKKTVNQEKDRLEAAIENGELKEIVSSKQKYDKQKEEYFTQEIKGVIAESYYAWDKRNQRFAGEKDATDRYYNPLSENCIEMGYIKGIGVTFAGDPTIRNDDNKKWKRILIAPPHDFGFKWLLGMFGSNKKLTIQLLKGMLPLKVEKGNFKDEKAYIKFSDEGHELALELYIKNIRKQIKRIRNRIELVGQIENRHFNGTNLLSRDPNNPIGTIARVENDVRVLVEHHNEKLNQVARNFNLMSRGIWEHEFVGLQDFFLTNNIKPNMKWVENEIEDMESRARK